MVVESVYRIQLGFAGSITNLFIRNESSLLIMNNNKVLYAARRRFSADLKYRTSHICNTCNRM